MVWLKEFENIYGEYAIGVYKFLLKLSGNHTIAEELTQETFYKAMKNIDSFKGTCKLYVWLCQIAKNEYINYQKKSERKNVHLDATNKTDDGNCFEQIFESGQIKEIHKALHKLDEPYKEVFSLRVFAELPFSDIAQLFNKSDSWARVTFFRAKERIIKILKEAGQYEV